MRHCKKKKKEKIPFFPGERSRVYRLAVMMAIIRPFNNDELATIQTEMRRKDLWCT